MTKATGIEPGQKIDNATLNSIIEAIDHDQNILNVAKELIKEVLQEAVDLENKKEAPSLEHVIEHIKGQEWSELFAESARRAAELIKDYLPN